jgi:hypothetical protein
MRPLHEIQALLHAYRDFSECIIDSIEWFDFGTTVRLSVDYVWMSDGSVRPDSDPKVIVTLTAIGVEELHVRNRLSTAQRDDVSRLNWGFAEVSMVSIRDDSSSIGTAAILEVLRESGVWISLRCADLTILE